MDASSPPASDAPRDGIDRRLHAGGRPGVNRLIGLALALPCLAVLLVAASLDADPAGYGTHTQLGLQPCGFRAATGMPCATCGMTTSFTHAADGRLARAFVTQPAGALLSLVLAMLTLVGGWAAWSGMPLRPLGAALWRPATVVVGVVVVLSAWAFTALRVLVSGGAA
ncbi:MAG: DUF2752 domain-containing protein [Planctomycetota bacterium]